MNNNGTVDALFDLDADTLEPTCLMDEVALSDWNKPEEETAWAYLQPGYVQGASAQDAEALERGNA